MGLDMYAFRCRKEDLKNPDATTDLEFAVPGFEATKMAQWRKFNALHGWMSDLYKQRGGSGEDFNCDTLALTANDLTELERVLDEGALKPRDGFFFGRQEIDPRDVDDTRRFITEARGAIAAGDIVFYDSWW